MISDKQFVGNGTILFTDFQNGGRGQQENKWESNKAENILGSFYFEPQNFLASEQFYMNMAVSLSLVNLLQNYADDIQIKWPNDIWIKQKKIAGILVENNIQGSAINYCIIGMGININQEIFDTENAISLQNILGENTSLQKIETELLSSLNYFFTLLENKEYALLKKIYREKLMGYQKWILMKDKENEGLAKIESIDEFGRIDVRWQITNELKKYQHKEIIFIRQR